MNYDIRCYKKFEVLISRQKMEVAKITRLNKSFQRMSKRDAYSWLKKQ